MLQYSSTVKKPRIGLTVFEIIIGIGIRLIGRMQKMRGKKLFWTGLAIDVIAMIIDKGVKNVHDIVIIALEIIAIILIFVGFITRDKKNSLSES